MTSDFHRNERLVDGLVQYKVIAVWYMGDKYFSDILLGRLLPLCWFLQFQLPNYKNFKGTIQELGQNQYVVSGEIFVVDRNTVEITELPVRTWTQVSNSEIHLHKNKNSGKFHVKLFNPTSG